MFLINFQLASCLIKTTHGKNQFPKVTQLPVWHSLRRQWKILKKLKKGMYISESETSLFPTIQDQFKSTHEENSTKRCSDSISRPMQAFARQFTSAPWCTTYWVSLLIRRLVFPLFRAINNSLVCSLIDHASPLLKCSWSPDVIFTVIHYPVLIGYTVFMILLTQVLLNDIIHYLKQYPERRRSVVGEKHQ